MKRSVRLIGLLLAVVMAFSVFTVSKIPASAGHLGIYTLQSNSKWASIKIGGGTLKATGCGIFALVNAVGYATGKRMDLVAVAKWAHSIGAYNPGNSSSGTTRGALYPKVQGKYGGTYGFKVNCNGGSGFWASSSSSTLKNHLKNHNNAAVCHVPGHFIALVDWNGSKYRVFDSYPTSARPTGPTGDCWKTPSQLTVGKLKLDWFCLITPTGSTPTPIPALDKSTAGTYKCTATQLNVRSGPGTDYSVLGSIKSGQQINVVGTRGIWAQFTFGGKTAYVSTKYLQKVTAPPPPPPKPPTEQIDTSTAGKYRVTAAELNVRAAADGNAKILGTLKNGQEITIVGTVKGTVWAKFTFGGKTAYTSTKFLEKVTAPPPTPPTPPPAPPTPPVAGEVENVARNAQYKGSANSATNGTGSYGEASWQSYHKGKLNDGTIIKVAANNTDKGTVEMCVGDISNVKKGTYQVIYQLSGQTRIASVKVFLNNRPGAASRGYPDKVEAFVGSSENVASATSIGSKTSYSAYDGSETARLCYIGTSSAVTGNYVIIQFTISDASRGVNDVSEIQIWSAETPAPPPTPPTPPVSGEAENVAPNAQYKGSTNSATNGTGSYGEASWQSYHSGKLNDRTIIKASTNATDKGTVEMCVGDITNVQKGSYQVIFKLAAPTSVASVKVFLNDRVDSKFRGYPDKVEAFVGSSENVASATSIGSKTSYSAYGGSATAKLCDIQASSAVTGSYVIVQFTISSVSGTYPGKGVNDVSEIEIWSAAAAQAPTEAENIAPGSQYKGSTNSATNGTGSYGEASWQSYHSGKLNDRTIIKASANATDKGTVEMCVGDITNVQKGSYQVIFKLAAPTSVASVKVFLNDRVDSKFRGYPDKVEAFVGSSENVASATSIGSKTSYSAYDGSATAKLCDIQASSAVTGSYVIVQFTISSISGTYPGKGVNDVSEIQIWSAGTAVPPPAPPTPPQPPVPPVQEPVTSAPVLSFTGGTQTADGNYVIQSNTALTVSWTAVANAASYDYKVEKYNGEISGTTPTLLLDDSTTGTSFTVPAQTDGKYYRITVTAVSSNEMTSEPAIITIAAPQSAAAGSIPIDKINEFSPNGDADGDCAVFTYDFTTTSMKFTSWRGFLLTPNTDGTYSVSEIYENGVAKDPAIFETSGGNVVLMVYSKADGYDVAKTIVLGNRLTLNGVYVDQNRIDTGANAALSADADGNVGTIQIDAPEEIYYGEEVEISWVAANAKTYNYKITNGSVTIAEANGVATRSVTIPKQTDGTAIAITITAVGAKDSKVATVTIGLSELVPDDITSASDSIRKDVDAFRGIPSGLTATEVLACFEQQSKYLEVYDINGIKLANTNIVGTGCVVKLVNTEISYMLIIISDVNGDGDITQTDYVAQKKSIKGVEALEGVFNDAADVNGDGLITALDIAALKASVKN